MTDQKPPRLAAGELATLSALLDYQRASFVRKVTGVDDAQASVSPVGSQTSLLRLTNHLADAEVTWVLHRFAGDREAGEAPAVTIEEAVARYRRATAAADVAIAAAGDLGATGEPFDDQPPPNLRWVIAHLLEETARHAGHADILRELIDGQTGR